MGQFNIFRTRPCYELDDGGVVDQTRIKGVSYPLVDSVERAGGHVNIFILFSIILEPGPRSTPGRQG